MEKKNILLTLDQRWHTLFSKKKPRQIKILEDKLNTLIKNQGQWNNDFKEYSLLKKKIMQDIIQKMPDAFEDDDTRSQKSMEKNKNYIEDINNKLEDLENKLLLIPKEIEDTNKRLLNLSMEILYKRMKKKKDLLLSMDKEIVELRDKIKELVVIRNENKEEYDLLYSYMHDMVGPNIIQDFDEKYLGESNND